MLEDHSLCDGSFASRRARVSSAARPTALFIRRSAGAAGLCYSFARVSAVLKLKVGDYYHNGARRRLRLHEKGGKEHEMPVHHLLEQILSDYVKAAGLRRVRTDFGEKLLSSLHSELEKIRIKSCPFYNVPAAGRS
jgi:hypothetical protein